MKWQPSELRSIRMWGGDAGETQPIGAPGRHRTTLPFTP